MFVVTISAVLALITIELMHLLGVHVRALNLATDYRATFFPCETPCSNQASCHITGWATAAEKSRNLTRNCNIVVYSVALGIHVDALHNISAYPTVCNLVFLDGRSILARRRGSGNTIGNWTIISTYGLDNDFRNMRRAGKIPKLSPDVFFDRNVQYAIYLDAKLKLIANPLQALQEHMLSFERVIMAAVRHPRSKSVTAEVNAIIHSQHSRPTITDSIVTVKTQASYYNSTGLLESGRQTMVEGAMLMHRVHHPAAITLRCAWLDQVLRYSDRDQVLCCISNAHCYGSQEG
jgi:hypothetical protein